MSTENPDNAQLVDYDDVDDEIPTEPRIQGDENVDSLKGHYAGMNSSSFKDFYLKDEILRAISECGFEHPSEVQHACIPRAITNKDVLCQAKSGMGKTAVFVISTLQMLKDDPENHDIQVLVIAHTRELAFQIKKEYDRFTKFMPNVRTEVFFGGKSILADREALSKNPAIVVGTPGRIEDLIKRGWMKVDKLRHFVVDECDHIINSINMRAQLQSIFTSCPVDKQVMMFTATLPADAKAVCLRFMKDPLKIELDDSALTLHGLQQYYLTIHENEKIKKLMDLLDTLEFNQIVIFVRNSSRARELSNILNRDQFNNTCITGDMKVEDRLEHFKKFKSFQYRILVSTQLFGRGIDVDKVNVVINYDFPEKADEYLHRVGRAGRFGTKGLAISFVTTEDDIKRMEEVQMKFAVDVPALPDTIDKSLYMNSFVCLNNWHALFLIQIAVIINCLGLLFLC